MGLDGGFLKFTRLEPRHEPVEERIKHFNEFIAIYSDTEGREQASRCMDCGIPFCQHQCPLHNTMPDTQQYVSDGDWESAWRVLDSTNSFPEITGRICPAPCEEGCTLGLHRDAVSIKAIEKKIAEVAFSRGYVTPQPAAASTGCSVAVVGSGPAGLAAAQQLARMGHAVTVYEKMDKPGGLLRYGIPDFKLGKKVVDRRLDQRGCVSCSPSASRGPTEKRLSRGFMMMRNRPFPFLPFRPSTTPSCWLWALKCRAI